MTDLDPFQWIMAAVNPYTGEDGFQKLQREAAGDPPDFSYSEGEPSSRYTPLADLFNEVLEDGDLTITIDHDGNRPA